MTALCRRTVLKGAAATCGAGVLAACGDDDDDDDDDAAAPAAPASPAAPTGGAAGGGAEPVSLVQLDQVPVGGAVSAAGPDGDRLLVVRPTEDEAVAFSAVCPHEGCTVAPDDGQLSCPCHGSAFELDGTLKRGPAERGLTPYAVQVVDGQVLPA